MKSLQEQNNQDLQYVRQQQAESAAWREQAAERTQQQLSQTLGGQRSSATGMPPRSNGQPYFTPGGFSETKSQALAGIFAPVFYCSAREAVRHLVEKRGMEQRASYPIALGHALDMVWRWKTWAFTILYWVVSGLCIWLWKGSIAMAGDPATGYTTAKDTTFQANLLLLHFVLLLPAILIPYCQHVDASFFKQRLLYRLLATVHAVVGKIPWVVLQTTVLLPLLFIIQYRW